MDKRDPAPAGLLQTGYRFGEFCLERDGTLSRSGVRVPLPARELAALRLLLAFPGQVVTPAELKQALWPHEDITPDSISKCIASLRKHLEAEECIQTVLKRGYRFSVEASPFEDEPASRLPRIAIPPFATVQGVPEFLGMVLAEGAADRLGGAVSIVAKDSVSALARRGFSPQQIGETLEADYVLAGELRRVSSRYRLRVQMIRIEDGAEIWVEERLVDHSRWAWLEIELPRLIALRMSGVGISTSASAGEVEERQWGPEQAEAYEIFARARYEWHTLERHRMQDALQQLLRAVELDPALVMARVDLAYLAVIEALSGFMPPAVAADTVRQAADSITDSRAREALLPALGWINFHFDRNLPAALKSFAHSAHLPYDPWIGRTRTGIALSRQRFGEAIDLLQSVIRVDPWSAWAQARLAWAHHLSGEAAASLPLAQAALIRFPEHEGVQLYGAIILAFNGESARAIEVARALALRLPSFDIGAAVHAYALAMAGRAEESYAILERLQWLSRERYTMNTFAPAAYVALGEFDQALEVLRASDQVRCPWFFQMLADPRLKSLRDRPEFKSMLGILAGMEADARRNPVEE